MAGDLPKALPTGILVPKRIAAILVEVRVNWPGHPY